MALFVELYRSVLVVCYNAGRAHGKCKLRRRTLAYGFGFQELVAESDTGTLLML